MLFLNMPNYSSSFCAFFMKKGFSVLVIVDNVSLKGFRDMCNLGTHGSVMDLVEGEEGNSVPFHCMIRLAVKYTDSLIHGE